MPKCARHLACMPGLSGIPCLALNYPASEMQGTYWMACIVWDESFGLGKKDVQDALNQQGIDTRPFFSPLGSLEAYKNQPGIDKYRSRNLVSYRLRNNGINLPSSLGLTK